MFTESRAHRIVAYILIWIQLLTPALSALPTMARADEPVEIRETVQGLNSLILGTEGAVPASTPQAETAVDPQAESGSVSAGSHRQDSGHSGLRGGNDDVDVRSNNNNHSALYGGNGDFDSHSNNNGNPDFHSDDSGNPVFRRDGGLAASPQASVSGNSPTAERGEEPAILAGLPDLALPADGGAAQEDNAASMLASGAMQAGTLLSEDNRTDAAVSYARSIGEGLINQQINDWLNQYGSAKLSVGTRGKISGDVLVPFSETDQSLFFTQLGARTDQERNTVNLGFGYRYYSGSWLLGGNAFWDYDYTGKNKRLGVGAEAWSDYLKLAANGYIRQTGWHQSPLKSMEDYDERPANGFDLRANAWLPWWPQLGGSLTYEQYFGKGVSVAGSTGPDALKNNPAVVTAGVEYTPFPLLTLSAKRSVGDSRETSVGLDFTWRFGVPWAQQASPDGVGLMRSLAGNIYDFVDRNYSIVMQYRKQELLTIGLPARVTAQAAETVALVLTVAKAKYGVKDVAWTVDPRLTTNGGSYRRVSSTELEVKLPAYIFSGSDRAAQEYTVSAVATDNHDNRSNTAETVIGVIPSENIISSLMVSPEGQSLAAGSAEGYTLTALVTDGKGAPLANRTLTFSLSGLAGADGASGATISAADGGQGENGKITVVTGSDGRARVVVRSTVAGRGTVTAVMDNGNSAQATVVFVADSASAAVTALAVTADNATADGAAANSVRVTVQDRYGNPVVGAEVYLSADNGAVIVEKATTGGTGTAEVTLTSKTAGASKVTASLGGGGREVTVHFGAGEPAQNGSDISTDAASYAAGDEMVVSVTLRDAQGNAAGGRAHTLGGAVTVPNAEAKAGGSWTESGDRPGVYTRTWVAKSVGKDLTATLSLSGWSKASGNTYSITASLSKAQVVALVVDKDNAIADGEEENSVKITVKDIYNNLVSGASVTLTASNGARIAETAATLGDGTAVATLTNTKAGSATVTASLNDSNKSVSVNFVVGKLAKANSTIAMDKESYTAGSEMQATVTLRDGNNNAASGQGNALAAMVTVANAEAKPGGGWAESSDNPGTYTRTYVAKISGENLTAALALSDGSKNSNAYRITAGAAVQSNSAIAVDKNSYTSGSEIQVSVTLQDAQGNMANGQAAILTNAAVSVANAEALSGSSWTEMDNSGIYTRAYIAKTAGDNLKATLKLADGSKVSGSYSIVAGVASQSNSSIVVDKESYTAGTEMQVTVTLKDSNANTASGQAGALDPRVTVANAEAKAGSSFTEVSAGVYTRTYLAKTTGEKLMATLALADGSKMSGAYSITAGAAAQVNSSIAVDRENYTAGAEMQVTIMLKDAQGNGATGRATTLTDVAVNVANAQAKAGGNWAESDGNPGIYTRIYIAKTAGDNLKAMLKLADGMKTSGTYSITAGVAVEANSSIVMDKDSYTSGTEMEVTVTLRDASGNAATGQSAPLAAMVKVANGEAKPDSTWTEASGNSGSYTRTYVAKTAGEYLTAILNLTDGDKKSGTYSITAGAAAQANSFISTGKNSYISGSDMLVTVTLRDGNGNIVSGQINALADRVKVANAEAKPGNSWTEESSNPGIYLRTYVAKTAGENLTATLKLADGDRSSNTYAITAGEPAKATSAIAVDKDSYIADTDIQVTVTLKDSSENNVPGLSNVVASMVKVANAEAKSGSSWAESNTLPGVYTRTYVAKTAGTGLKATMAIFDWGGEVASGIYAITADSGSAEVSAVVLNGDVVSKVANGSNSFSYTVTVIDNNGNPVPAMEITPAASDTENVLIAANGKTNASGQAVVTLTSTQKAAYDIIVSVKAGSTASVAADRKVSFIADSSTAQVSTVALIGDVTSKVADGVSSFSYTVTVVDGNGNPVAGTSVMPTASNTNDVRVEVNGKTNASGQATLILTSSKKAVADITVSAQTGTTASVNADKKVSFTADSSTAQVGSVHLDGDILSKVADGSNSFSYTVTIIDGNGNPVPDMTVVPTASDTENVRVAVEGVTNASGQTVITLTSTKKAAYGIIVSAKAGTTASAAADKKVSFTADSSTAQVSTVILIGDVVSKVANGSNSFSYTVTVIDGNGNPVPDMDVMPSAGNTEYARVDMDGPTNASGQAIITLTSSTRAATDITVSAQTGMTASVNADKKVSFTADSSTAQVSSVILNSDVVNKIANGTSSFTFTVTVLDGNENPVSGVEITPAASGYDSEYTHIAVNGKTNASGETTITLASTTRAAYDITVSAKMATAAGVDADKKVSFIADINTARVGWVVLNDTTLSKVANGTDSFSYTAQLVDGYGNWIIRQSGTIKWTQDKGAQVNLPESSQIGENGQATVEMTSSHLVSDIQVSAQYLATPSVNADKKVSFIRGAVAKVTVSMAGGGTEAVVSKESNYPLIVAVEDAYGHPIPNQQISLSVAGSAGGKPGIYPASAASDAGGAIATRPEVGDTTAETVTVTATVKGSDIKGVLNIIFKAGAVSAERSTIKASPNSIKADNQATSTLIFVPKDEFGNVITDLNTAAITSAVTGMSATAIKLGGWSYGSGQYTATATAGTATGSLLVIPVVNGVDGVSRTSAHILTLTAGDPDVAHSSIKAFPASIAANGKQTTILQFKPADKYGNFIDSLNVSSISQVITGTAADLTVGAWSYNKVNGYYQATLTAGVIAGKANIMPTLNGADAASVGVTDTLSLVNNSSVSRIELDSATTDLAVADGEQINYIRFNFYGKDGQRLTGVRFTITPGNPEMTINKRFLPINGTSNQDGQGGINIASTLSGANDFIIEADSFGERFSTTFSTYVSPTLSGITFDKRNLLNNGTDKMTVTFRPVDAKGRLVEDLKVAFASTDTGATLTTAGYKTVVSSKSTTSTYFLSVKMNNYMLWQPDASEYQLIPVSGIRLAVLTVSPVLCGALAYHSQYICTPTVGNNGKYIASGLGFEIKLVDKSDNWDGILRLNSDTVDGSVYLVSLDGKTRQDCSVPVSDAQSWMNDYGKSIDGVANTLEFNFASKTQFNTVTDIGFIEPGGGGGIGHCSIDDKMYINVNLSGSGHVQFKATTISPPSTNYFVIPVGDKRVDAGIISPVSVYIYSN